MQQSVKNLIFLTLTPTFVSSLVPILKQCTKVLENKICFGHNTTKNMLHINQTYESLQNNQESKKNYEWQVKSQMQQQSLSNRSWKTKMQCRFRDSSISQPKCLPPSPTISFFKGSWFESTVVGWIEIFLLCIYLKGFRELRLFFSW